MASVNVVALVGNLTRDPELRQAGDSQVCKLGIAVNERVKRGEVWEDVPNYFDVEVWGGQAEACATYLTKGNRVGVQGSLRWRSWEADDGSKRSAVSVRAQVVQFLTPKGEGASATPETDDDPFGE